MFACLQIVDPHYPLPVEAHMGIILAPLVAFNLIPSLKLLAPFSALANVLTFVGLGIIVYYLSAGRRADLVEKNLELDLWGSAATFPLFFGTVLFALTAVGVVRISELLFDHLVNNLLFCAKSVNLATRVENKLQS